MLAGGVAGEAFPGAVQVAGRRHAVAALQRRLRIAALVLAAGCGGGPLVVQRHVGLQLHREKLVNNPLR